MMQTMTINIINPKAEKLLQHLADLDLISIQESPADYLVKAKAEKLNGENITKVDSKEVVESDNNKSFLKELKGAISEVKHAKKGKLKLKSAEELINEL
jgi:hypothetical protein